MDGTVSLSIQFWVREKFGWIFGFVFIKPTFLFFKILNKAMPKSGMGEVFKNTIYTFRLDRGFDRALYKILKIINNLGSLISGIKSWRMHYGEILSATPGKPFIGLMTGDTHTHFGIQGKSYADGSHGVDGLLYSDSTKIGVFSMVEKKERGNQYEAHCVWLSGKFSGKKFVLGEVQNIDDIRIRSSNETIPNQVFAHSPVIKLLAGILALLGVSNILEFLGVIDKLKQFSDTVTRLLK